MEERHPLILVSNDDGVEAKGIRELVKAVRSIGDVVVVAPDSARSGSACALTTTLPVHYKLVRQEPGLKVYKCSGTPVDCVKMALHNILERKPDLVLSGINHGDNAAINVHYSGTMGVVLEGCFNGIASIGFSLDSHNADANFEPLKPYIIDITLKALRNGINKNTCLNVNFPNVGEIKGVKVTTMNHGHWTQEWEACPRTGDNNYYWLTGHFVSDEPNNEKSDRCAINNGYAAITPIKIDMTDYDMVDRMKEWF